MRTIGLLMVTAALGIFSGALGAEEAYHVVNIWPELPQGWHFYQPWAVAVDQLDNVYIGDFGNYSVKKFDSEGRFITQWGSPGQGDGQFSTIRFVKVGCSRTVYVVDRVYEYTEPPMGAGRTGTGRIQKFTPYGQFVGLFERKAPGADRTDLPIDVAVDWADTEEWHIRRATIEKYSPAGEFFAQWGIDAGSGDGQLKMPTTIAVDAEGNIYVADGINNCVQKFDPSGKFLLTWGTPGHDEGRFLDPLGIAIGESGNVYVVDRYGVQKFTAEGRFLAGWRVPDGPGGIALDSHGNIYVPCRSSPKVLKFNSAGKVVAEWGNAHAGEDGHFVHLSDIAVEPSGVLLVSDDWSHRIQRFTAEGRFISKWGGDIFPDVWGLATDTSGNLYVACGDANEVQKLDPQGRLICRWGSSGSGDGQFRFVSSIAIGPSGSVYVTDFFNHRVQKFTSGGRFLAKWGTKGRGDGQLDEPFFIAVDQSGNVWVGDQLGNGTHRMQKFDAHGTFLATWTRKLARGTIRTKGPVAVDSAGNSFCVSDNRIEKYDAEGNRIGNYGQKGLTDNALGPVWGMCVDQAGCLYMTGPADPSIVFTDATGSIRKFDADGKFITKWTAENTGRKERFPNGPITVDQAGSMYTACLWSPSIQKLSSEGKLVGQFRIAAPREARFLHNAGVAVDRSGRVYVVDSIGVDWDYGLPSIKQFDPNGQIVTTWDVAKVGEGRIKFLIRIALDGAGNMYVTDQSSHCVHKLDAQGRYLKSWGEKGTGDGQFDTPEGIAVDGAGHVYVCDRQNSRIQKFDSDGDFLAKWGKEGSGNGEFHFPAAVAVDREGHVFVADSDNHRVQKFTAEGRFLTQWGEFGEGPGQLNVPLGIAVDKEGNVYVSDSHNQRIQKFAPVVSR
jgi:tripartite motif-containing protein 71